MKRWGIPIVCMCVLFLAPWVASAGAAKFTIKFGSANEPDHYHTLAGNKFAELVKARTNGEVEVNHFPAQQLGTEPEMVSLTQGGTMQMVNVSPGNLGNYVKEFQVMLCPFLWRDYAHLQKTMEGPVGKELADKLLANNGLKVLDTLWVNGARHLTTKSLAVAKPDDLKGVKIRSPQAPIYLAAVKSLGAIPVPVDFAELYMALQQGVAEGQENALGTIDSKKYYEVQKFVSLTGHIYQSQVIVMNARFFNSLPENYQKVILDAMKEAREYNNKLQLEADDKALEKFTKLGMKIIKPNVELFRENATKYMPELYPIWGGQQLYDRIVAVK
jgi:tripartite ATP-independent transporter DctP family solute receptor